MKNLIILLLATTVAWAQPRWMDDDNDSSPRFGRMMLADKLNLTDEQQKQFDKLQSDLQKKQIGLRSKIQSMRIDVRDEFRGDKLDKGKIESKLGEISKLQNEMKMNHVAFWFDVNKILTPDQQKVWKEHHVMLGRGMDRHHGRKRGGIQMGMGWRSCPHCFSD